MITKEVVQRLFAEQGLKFVDDACIPSALKQKGWKAESWQKERKRRWPWGKQEILVIHLIYGPDPEGKQVCLREDVLVVSFKAVKGSDGVSIKEITEVGIDAERLKQADPCVELFQAMTDAEK